MFTGIIEEIGRVQKITLGKNSATLTISAEKILDDIALGDSIAVNGVCLTATAFTQNSFRADIMHETLNRSSLASLKIGNLVNLERAMPANGRFGGHIVSGHIDGTGIITDIQKDGNALWYNVETTSEILHFIIEKGSIAVDGISLTVATVTKNSFKVSVIPHTIAKTILVDKKRGDKVNLENDCVGKYVAHLLSSSQRHASEEKKSDITSDLLVRCGF